MMIGEEDGDDGWALPTPIRVNKGCVMYVMVYGGGTVREFEKEERETEQK